MATLTLTSGGHVSCAAGTLGNFGGSSGAVSISGIGSSLNQTGSLVVGSSGTGILSVTNGASLTSTGASIGLSDGSVGAATISGATSAWLNNGLTTLDIGSSGVGSLSVLNGGTVSTSGINLGANPGAAGSLTLDGVGALVDSPTAGVFVGGTSVVGGGNG